MTVRLRMAIHGTRNNRIFHLVAIDHRRRRDGKPIELLGIYSPSPASSSSSSSSPAASRAGTDTPAERAQAYKTMRWSVDRIRYWLGVGAVPSKPVVRMLEWGGVLPPDSKYHGRPSQGPSVAAAGSADGSSQAPPRPRQ